MARLLKYISSLMTVLVIFSCGYKFAGSGKLPANVDALYVNVFTNNSSESGWETRFASELISEFSRNGIKTVSDNKTAKTLFYGNIKSITSEGISHSIDSTTLEQRITATIDVKITDKTGVVIWQKNGLVRSKEFATADDSVSNPAKKEAMQGLAEDFADYINSLLTEDF